MRKIISIILIFGWAILIFSFSDKNGDESGNYSDNLISNTIAFISPVEKNSSQMEKLVKKLSFPVRKTAHFIMYFILAILIMNGFHTFDKEKYSIIYVPIICILFAISDEIHQLFINGRSGQVSDVFLDSSASLIGSYIYYILYKRIEKIKKRIKNNY